MLLSRRLLFSSFVKSRRKCDSSYAQRMLKKANLNDLNELMQICIVGRSNVGKSSLFNCLMSQMQKKYNRFTNSIVSEIPGSTRDRREGICVFGNLAFRLVDTGGLEYEGIHNAAHLLYKIKEQVVQAIQESKIVLFVIDAKHGVKPLDKILAKFLISQINLNNKKKIQSNTSESDLTSLVPKSLSSCKEDKKKQKIVLIANKAESCYIGEYLNECYELELGHPVIISATAKEGLEDIYDRLVLELRVDDEEEFESMSEAESEDTAREEEETLEGNSGSPGKESCGMASPLKGQRVKASSCNNEACSSEALTRLYALENAVGGLKYKCAKENVLSTAKNSGIFARLKYYEDFVDSLEEPKNDKNINNNDDKSNCMLQKSDSLNLISENKSQLIIGELEAKPSGFANASKQDMLNFNSKDEIAKHDIRGVIAETQKNAVGDKNMYAEQENKEEEEEKEEEKEKEEKEEEEEEKEEKEKEEKEKEEEEEEKEEGKEEKEEEKEEKEEEEKEKEEEEEEEEEYSLEENEEEDDTQQVFEERKLSKEERKNLALKERRKELMDETINLVIVGRPNAGKSTLVNALLQQERVIVDEMCGTTTDSVTTDWQYKNHSIRLIDTAGVSKGWKMRGTDLLVHSSLQTLRNIRRCQIAILCIDSTAVAAQRGVGKHELGLGNLISEKEGRCLCVAITKWDAVEDHRKQELRNIILQRIQNGFSSARGCPVVFISAKVGFNLELMMNKILLLYKRWNYRIPTSKINGWLREFLIRWPPPWRKGSKCSVKYITQVKARPPTFVLWTNVYGTFPANYLRQIMNNMRQEFSLNGTPMRVILRTTCMPNKNEKLTKSQILKWKRMGPKQAEAVSSLNRHKKVKQSKQ